MKTSKAIVNFMFWVVISVIINILIYYTKGGEASLQFLGGYIIEMSLSIDNLFLFMIVFSTFNVKEDAEHRALDYGIFVAIVLRLLFICLGVKVVETFNSVLYIFGAILIVSGIKMLFTDESSNDPSNGFMIKVLRRFIPFTNNYVGNKFFVRRNGRLFATPLFAVLIVIELSDILFAIDSIPAIFSITTDEIIVYASNICAIICLRSMYFILAKLTYLFKYVKYGVMCVLIFTGTKLVLVYFGISISIGISILIIAIILLFSMLMSLIFG